MALNETSKEFISLKKLQGKAHTSNNKDLANGALSSGLTVSAKTVFSTDIPSSPTATQYAISGGAVQFVRLSASFIPGSDTVAGRHAFALSLPDDYQTPNGTTNGLSKPPSTIIYTGIDLGVAFLIFWVIYLLYLITLIFLKQFISTDFKKATKF